MISASSAIARMAASFTLALAVRLFGNMMSGAMIIRGPYVDVARVLNEIENTLPEG